MNKLAEKLNGKKLPITALATALIGVGVLQAQVKNNTKEITLLRPAKEQIAIVTQDVKDFREDFVDFRTEQRKVNEKSDNKMEKIGDKLDVLIQAIPR